MPLALDSPFRPFYSNTVSPVKPFTFAYSHLGGYTDALSVHLLQQGYQIEKERYHAKNKAQDHVVFDITV